MASTTRINDSTSGTCDVGEPCCPHGRSGTNSTGSPNVYINSRKAHRLGDTGGCNCPHGGTFQSTQGSSSVFVNSKPLTRIGDQTICQSCGQPGSHVSGSNNVFAN